MMGGPGGTGGENGWVGGRSEWHFVCGVTRRGTNKVYTIPMEDQATQKGGWRTCPDRELFQVEQRVSRIGRNHCAPRD